MPDPTPIPGTLGQRYKLAAAILELHQRGEASTHEAILELGALMEPSFHIRAFDGVMQGRRLDYIALVGMREYTSSCMISSGEIQFGPPSLWDAVAQKLTEQLRHDLVPPMEIPDDRRS